MLYQKLLISFFLYTLKPKFEILPQRAVFKIYLLCTLFSANLSKIGFSNRGVCLISKFGLKVQTTIFQKHKAHENGISG